MKRTLLAVAASVLVVSCAAAGTADAAHKTGGMSTHVITLHPLNGSGVTGTSRFDYNIGTGRTTVTLTVKNLKPATIHPAYIREGASCAANGRVLYRFTSMSGSTTLQADNNGVLVAKSSFHGSYRAYFLYVDVQDGSSMDTKAEPKIVACGDEGIRAADAVSTHVITLHPLNGSGVTGSVRFDYNIGTGKTTATLTVKNLKPLSIHPAHLHEGASCAANGPVLYTFTSTTGATALKADNNGVLVAKSSFPGSYRSLFMYVNVHAGPGMDTKPQASVLACGVVK